MREFDITVNGKTYSVQVVEKTANTVSKAPPAAAPAAPAVAPPAAPPVAPPVFRMSEAKKKAAPVSQTAAGGSGSVVSPMPGRVLRICVKAGEPVGKGDILCVIEAMKMENEVHAPVTGTVAEIFTSEGSSVAVNEPILRIE